MIENIRYKKILSFVILLIYATINYPNINEQLTQKRLSGFLDYQTNLNNNMKHICKEEEIIDKNSYMRYWHKKYNSDFLRELCESYFRK